MLGRIEALGELKRTVSGVWDKVHEAVVSGDA